MNVFLLHGLGGSPEGNVLRLELALRQSLPSDTTYCRLLCPHSDRSISRETATTRFREEVAPLLSEGSLVIGISMGGFMALKAQEEGKKIDVIGISSPSMLDKKTKLEPVITSNIRTVFYSPLDEVIANRTTYPVGVDAVNIPFLDHDTEHHIHSVALLIQARLGGYLDSKFVEELVEM